MPQIFPISTSRPESCHACNGVKGELDHYSLEHCSADELCEKCFSEKVRRLISGHSPFDSDNPGIPWKYRNCSFQNFNTYSDELRAKMQVVCNWCEEQGPPGLFLAGPAGSGKTHLSVAALREIARSYLRVRNYFYFQFVNARHFVHECQSSFNERKSLVEIIDDLMAGGLLIFDDLHGEKPTDFALGCIYELVDRVYSQGKSVIFTSNADVEKLHEFAPAVASRIIEMCELVRLDAPDYRVRLARQRREVDRTASDRGTT